MHLKTIIPDEDTFRTISMLAAAGEKREAIAAAIGVSKATFSHWVILGDYPEAKAAYKVGKQEYANDLADKLMEEAYAPLPDNPKLANASVARQKHITDNIKWIASRLLPKVYGDHLKIDHEHTGEVVLSPLAQLRQLEERGPVLDLESLPPIKRGKGHEEGGGPHGEEVTEDDCF